MASPLLFGLAASLLVASVSAQQAGTYTPEVHPGLTSQQCTISGGCKTVNTSVVLDANYRWLHNVGGYQNCGATEGFNTSVCADAESCSTECAVEGVDYASYGISTSGDSLTLNLFKTENNVTSMTSPRVYLLANETTYDMFTLLNQEIAFDVDLSKVACGVNGALYLAEMDSTGDADALNPAGAQYGAGYCDAQCPSQKYINGVANMDGTVGACCSEMDLWEANSAANAFTPHPCNVTGTYACEDPLCGDADRYAGVCDKDGCGYNAYQNGVHDFYGPGMTVDTMKKFTVVTQFLTSDNSSTGTLTEIRRVYVQDGVVYQNPNVNITGLAAENDMSDAYCTAQKEAFGATDDFAAKGGLTQMGEALGRGMVLIFSIWDDAGGGMQWLDGTTGTGLGGAAGPCSADSGNTTMIQEKYPDSQVTFSNIKAGDIGSTFSAGVNATMSLRTSRARMGHL